MSTSVVLDAAGRRRSPATLPGHHAGRVPRNKGQRYPADPPTVEEIIAVMRQTPDDRHGFSVCALIVVLWRAGLRVKEALALAEPDLDERRGSLLVRSGKGGRRREIGMDAWGWEHPASLARRPRRFAGRPAVLRHRRLHPRSGVVKRRGAARASPTRSPGRCAATLRAASAPPRPRNRARPRRHCPQHHPTAARPRQPRHDVHIPAGHRHRRDHRRRPLPTRPDDVCHCRAPALTNGGSAPALPPTLPLARAKQASDKDRLGQGLTHASRPEHARAADRRGRLLSRESASRFASARNQALAWP